MCLDTAAQIILKLFDERENIREIRIVTFFEIIEW